MKKLSTGLVPGSIRAGEGMSGSNALGLGARVGAPAERDSEGLPPDIAPPVSPTTAGCLLARVRGERCFGAASVGCWLCEATTGGGAVGDVAVVGVVSDASGVVEDGEEGEAEVEAGVDGGREGAAEEAELLPDVKPSCLDTEAACPDCVSMIVDAPLSGGRVAMVPARTSARRKNLLTRAPPSSEISQVSGSWPLM